VKNGKKGCSKMPENCSGEHMLWLLEHGAAQAPMAPILSVDA